MSQLIWNDFFLERFCEDKALRSGAGCAEEFAAPENNAMTGRGGVRQHGSRKDIDVSGSFELFHTARLPATAVCFFSVACTSLRVMNPVKATKIRMDTKSNIPIAEKIMSEIGMVRL
jgi:hypothetical protein